MLKPNLFIIGAPKAGTTSITAAIAEHPEIFVPAVKETRYFDSNTFYDLDEDHPLKSVDKYLDLYRDPKAGARYAVDGSVFNMYSMDSIQRILDFSPDAKFVLVLRDPLAASKSMFRQRMKTFYTHLREVDEDFYRCWDLLPGRAEGRGLPKGCRNAFLFRYDLMYRYELYVPELKRRLGDRLHIALFDDFIQRPSDFYADLFGFLGVEPFTPSRSHLNDSVGVRRTAGARLFYALASASLPLRRVLGLRHLPPALRERLVQLRSKLLKSDRIVVRDDLTRDAEIRRFFADSIACMQQARRKETAG